MLGLYRRENEFNYIVIFIDKYDLVDFISKNKRIRQMYLFFQPIDVYYIWYHPINSAFDISAF